MSSRDPYIKACFNPPHDGITKTKGLPFRQKKSVLDGVKSLGKIRVDDINCVDGVKLPVFHQERRGGRLDTNFGQLNPGSLICSTLRV